MTSQDLTSMVDRYFAAVDAEDWGIIRALLTPACVFRVETHGVELRGHAQIETMFRTLWANHRAVSHHSFRHICEGARVSSQFQVENTELDGSLTRKSNCNFFDVEGAQFSAVSVYMAGGNTLEG
jgi:hypothetical protein